MEKTKNFIKTNIDSIAAFCSVIGLFVTMSYNIYYIYNSDSESGFVPLIICLVIVNILFGILTAYILHRYYKTIGKNSKFNEIKADLVKQIAEKKNILRETTKILHNINHQSRDLLTKLQSDIELSDFSRYEKRRATFRLYIMLLTSNVKTLFDILTKDECSVCIKLVVQNSEKESEHVKTLFRDNISYRERREVDYHLESYPITSNTAYREITDLNKDNYFLCNDLSSRDNYININKDWKKYYNATLVSPIMHRISKDPNNYSLIGFLCVDNKIGNFDKDVAVDILGSSADILYSVLDIFNVYEERHKKNNTSE